MALLSKCSMNITEILIYMRHCPGSWDIAMNKTDKNSHGLRSFCRQCKFNLLDFYSWENQAQILHNPNLTL